MSNRKFNFNPIVILRDKSERAILMICMSIAFVFWIAVKMTETYEREIKVNIEFKSPSDNLMLSKVPPNQLIVTVKGSGWDLFWVKSPNLSYFLTFDDAKETRVFRQQLFRYDIASQLENKDIEIITLIPEQISLKLDIRTNKRVRVEFKENIKIAPQFTQIGSTVIQPENVLVTGPANEVNKIESWQTEPFEVEGMNKRIKNSIPLQSHPNKQVSFAPQAVTYDIIIEELTEKELILPIELIGDTAGLKIFPNQIRVKCNVGLSNYDRLTADNFSLIIDANNIKDKERLPIIIQKTPTFIQHVTYEMNSVNYLISVENSHN